MRIIRERDNKLRGRGGGGCTAYLELLLGDAAVAILVEFLEDLAEFALGDGLHPSEVGLDCRPGAGLGTIPHVTALTMAGYKTDT